MNDDNWALTPPPFKAEEALQRLKRDLRDAGLSEREGHFERRGLKLARAALAVVGADGGAGIQASIVKRPSRSSPEWLHSLLKSSADVRDFVADLKKKLSTWSDTDD